MRSKPFPLAIAAVVSIAAAIFFSGRARAAEAEDLYFENTNPVLDWEPLPAPIPDEIMSTNLDAFLWMIRRAEHSDLTIEQLDAGFDYGRFYSGLRFNNFSDHPVITGERRGVRLSDAMCRAAGFKPGCVTTAAGAFQIIRPTWQRVRAAGSWGPRLPDFGPESQREAARRLLMEVGALNDIEAGKLDSAIRLAAPFWASLPGSLAQQRPKSMQTVLAYFEEGLRYG